MDDYKVIDFYLGSKSNRRSSAVRITLNPETELVNFSLINRNPWSCYTHADYTKTETLSETGFVDIETRIPRYIASTLIQKLGGSELTQVIEKLMIQVYGFSREDLQSTVEMAYASLNSIRNLKHQI